MILDEIKKANVQAMKDRNQVARAIYGVVMTKAMLEQVKKREKEEDFVDADMVAILQKTLKELNDEGENFGRAGKADEVAKIEEQKKIVEGFLPQMLSQEEIYNIISAQPDKSVPAIMKHFKANYAGKCEMRLVQEVLKKFN